MAAVGGREKGIVMSSRKKSVIAGLVVAVVAAGADVAIAGSRPGVAVPGERANVTSLAAGGKVRVIIQFADQPAEDADAAQQRGRQVVADVGLQSVVTIKPLRRLATGADLYEVQATSSLLTVDSVIASLGQHPSVVYAERDRLLQRNFVPNDPSYPLQWHYSEASAGINLPLAWDHATGNGSTVAVLDTGYRPHADLVANILPGYDFISDLHVANDGDGRDSDAKDPGDWVEANDADCGDGTFYASSWHGTHVSGTIAAVTNNSLGVAGVSYKSKVIVGRVLGVCGGYTSDIADAIVWASGGLVSGVPTNANVADVINMSLGGSSPSCDTTTQNAINTARSNGTAVVVSAGNSNTSASSATPANCNGVITVGAVGRAGTRAYYSNYGSVVDVSAPGGSYAGNVADLILSTLNDGVRTPGNDSYAYYQGTSMAAPHVTGIVALLREVRPSITPDEIECTLKATARAFPATPDQPIGAGIVDANAAVLAAMQPTLPTVCGGVPPPPPVSCVIQPGDNVIDKRNARKGQRVTGLRNKRNVIFGSPYDDQLTGGGLNDCIDGGAGNDMIKGLDGNDLLIGGPGNDTIVGGPGTDTCSGEAKSSCEITGSSS